MSSLSSDRLVHALSALLLALSLGALLAVFGALVWGAALYEVRAPTPEELAAFSPADQAAIKAAMEATPSLSELLFGTTWAPTEPGGPRFGARGMLQASVLVALGALSLAAPVGLGVSSWLVTSASAVVRARVRPLLEVLAGIPTVVLGLIAVALLSPRLSSRPGGAEGLSALNGASLLAFMALPTVIALATRALESVPEQRVRAAMALGADRWQTLTQVRLPGAAAGLCAAITVGFGRALGETMIVLMACGNALEPSWSLLDPARTLTATLALEVEATFPGGVHRQALFALGLLLFVGTFAVNLVGELLFARQEVRS